MLRRSARSPYRIWPAPSRAEEVSSPSLAAPEWFSRGGAPAGLTHDALLMRRSPKGAGRAKLFFLRITRAAHGVRGWHSVPSRPVDSPTAFGARPHHVPGGAIGEMEQSPGPPNALSGDLVGRAGAARWAPRPPLPTQSRHRSGVKRAGGCPSPSLIRHRGAPAAPCRRTGSSPAAAPRARRQRERSSGRVGARRGGRRQAPGRRGSRAPFGADAYAQCLVEKRGVVRPRCIGSGAGGA